MAKQTFTTGQVLTAAQMTSLQQTAMGGGSATAKTASYVLVAADAGTTVIMNAAGATTITVNTSLFSQGDSVFIQNIGAGTCTVTAGTATVSTAGSLALTQYEGGLLYFTAAGTSVFHDYVQAGGGASPLTTKGDLYGFSTLDARIPIGTNNQVLTADSAQALGLKWATPAAGGGMTLLSTTATTSGSSVTISSISGSYKNLLVIGTGITGTNNTDSSFRFNSNSSSVYSGYNVNYISTTLSGNVNNSNLISGSAVGTSTAYSDSTNFTMNIYRYSEGSEFKNITIYSKSKSTVDVGRWTTASFGSNTAISSITYTLDAGTLATGNIYIYGVN